MVMMMAKMGMVLKMTIMAVISKMLLMAHWANQVVATSPHKTEFTDSATTGLCQKKKRKKNSWEWGVLRKFEAVHEA